MYFWRFAYKYFGSDYLIEAVSHLVTLTLFLILFFSYFFTKAHTHTNTRLDANFAAFLFYFLSDETNIITPLQQIKNTFALIYFQQSSIKSHENKYQCIDSCSNRASSSVVVVDTLKLIEFAQFIPFLFAYLFYSFFSSHLVPRDDTIRVFCLV